MTSLTHTIWSDLTPDYPAEVPENSLAIGSFAAAFRKHLFFGVLAESKLENADALLTIRSKVSAGDAWKVVAELALIRRDGAQDDESQKVRIFAGVVSDAGLLRIDVLGGGYTATVTSADGKAFELSEATEMGTPVLEAARVVSQAEGIVAIARKSGAESFSLWKATGPRSSEWQELADQPAAPSLAYGPGAVAFAGGRLWAAFRNPVRGFEIWSSAWEQENTAWTKALQDGAWKWAANSDVFAMTSFEGACYAATGVNDAQQKKLAAFHRRGFELLRMYPQGDWDLLAGTPVFTPDGLRAPLSAKGPGLDHLWNDRVLSLISHSGVLFLLGRDLETLKLWNSQDGESWDALPMNNLPPLGIGLEFELASTPFGLVLTTQPSEAPKPIAAQIFLLED